MPLTITKKGDKFCVVDPAGKQFGCHDTKAQAVKQIGAIESKKMSKSAIDLVAEDNIRIMAAELKAEHGTEQPPIIIMSDGTPEGTHILVHGQLVDFKRMDIYCSHDPDYPHCSFSITMESTDDDGLLVEKTLTLRKEPPAEKASPALVGQKKADPGARVRNRGNVVFASTNAKVKDNKDHFPINDDNQARNALSRVAQFDTVPKWWGGSLRQLQAAVRNAVKRNFRSINVTEANAGNQGFALFYTTGSFRWLIKEN